MNRFTPHISTLIITLCIAGLCHYGEGLHCYASISNHRPTEETVVACEDALVLPTVKQMKNIVESSNDTNEYKVGKLACKKQGFQKGCAFVAENQKMECTKIPNSDVKRHLATLAQGRIASLSVKECFCNMDRCNNGIKLSSSTTVTLLASVMITTLLRKLA